MWRDAAPFLLAVLFVVASPTIDDLMWRNAYMNFYRSHGCCENGKGTLCTPENLTSGASWAVDLAHVVPGVLLAWVGIVVLLPQVGDVLALIGVPVSLLPFCLAARMQSRAHLHQYVSELVWRRYSAPQLLVALVNLVGLLTAVTVHVV